MFCVTCGNELVKQAVLCVKCGSPTANFNPIKKPPEVSTWALVCGYIFAPLIPVIGIALGIILIFKHQKAGHGAAILGLSVLWWAVYMITL